MLHFVCLGDYRSVVCNYYHLALLFIEGQKSLPKVPVTVDNDGENSYDVDKSGETRHFICYKFNTVWIIPINFADGIEFM